MPPRLTTAQRSRFVQLQHWPGEFSLGGFRASMLGYGFYPPRWWRNRLHRHSFYEICAVYAGTGTFLREGVLHKVSAGDVFVARPGELHEIVSSRHRPMGIWFWSATLLPDSRSQSSGSAADTLMDAFVRGPVAARARAWPICAVCDLLSAEAAAGGPGCAEAIRALLVKLLLDTARAVVPPLPCPAPSEPATGRNALARAAVRFLQDNFQRPLSLDEVAAQINRCPRQTARLIRQETGGTLGSLLARLRLEAAAQRLLETRAPLKAVAAACGFGDVRHFITRFRRRFGLAPGAFRARGGTEHLPTIRATNP